MRAPLTKLFACAQLKDALLWHEPQQYGYELLPDSPLRGSDWNVDLPAAARVARVLPRLQPHVRWTPSSPRIAQPRPAYAPRAPTVSVFDVWAEDDRAQAEDWARLEEQARLERIRHEQEWAAVRSDWLSFIEQAAQDGQQERVIGAGIVFNVINAAGPAASAALFPDRLKLVGYCAGCGVVGDFGGADEHCTGHGIVRPPGESRRGC